MHLYFETERLIAAGNNEEEKHNDIQIQRKGVCKSISGFA